MHGVAIDILTTECRDAAVARRSRQAEGSAKEVRTGSWARAASPRLAS